VGDAGATLVGVTVDTTDAGWMVRMVAVGVGAGVGVDLVGVEGFGFDLGVDGVVLGVAFAGVCLAAPFFFLGMLVEVEA